MSEIEVKQVSTKERIVTLTNRRLFWESHEATHQVLIDDIVSVNERTDLFDKRVWLQLRGTINTPFIICRSKENVRELAGAIRPGLSHLI